MLGRHRIICGDARQGEVLREVLGDERVDVVFTDPPCSAPTYGRPLGRDVTQPCDFDDVSGEVKGDEFRIFLRQVLGNAAAISRDGALHFVCMEWTHIADLIEAGRTTIKLMRSRNCAPICAGRTMFPWSRRMGLADAGANIGRMN
jgi:hypothetical protein